MSKVNFFTELFPLLEDKESIELKVQRTGDELTVLLVPKIRSKTATVTISGSPEDLNDGFMEQLTIPVEKIKGLISNAAEVKIEDVEEEEEEESEDNDDKKEKPEAKKAAPKKAAAKKVTSKKAEEVKPVEPVVETKTEEEFTPAGKSTEEIEAEIEKQRIADEAAAKEAADKAAQEKAEQEAEEKRKAEEEEKIKAEKAAFLQETFNTEIKLGDEAFEARKYEDAEKHYELATKILPDHKAAKEKFLKAEKWVNQLIAAKILPARKEVVDHGA